MRTPFRIAATLFLVAASQALAQTPARQPGERTLAVTGTGEISAAPDLAVVHLAVETEATDAAGAAQRNAALAERVLQAVRAALGERGKAFTAGYSIHPEYEQPRPDQQVHEPRIRGYRASNEVRVEVRDLARVGGVIDAAIGAGANRVANLYFALEQREPHVRAALAAAGTAAKAEAEAAAAALGVRLGPVLAARTGGAEPPRPMPMPHMAQMAVRDGGAPTPVSPGDVTVQVVLEVTYRID
jgi:uncharacterized protein YggE